MAANAPDAPHMKMMMQQMLSTPNVQAVARLINEPEAKARTAIATALPVMVAALGQEAATADGAERLAAALDKDHDGAILNELDNYIVSGGDVTQGRKILKHVLGDRQARIEQQLATAAKVDVGMDVPIVTSQQSSSELSSGGDTGILQSIEYRKTGILLSVKPIVYSGNRVDLKVSQEMSEVSSTKSSDVQSPSILTRRIETNLSLQDGGSVLLGGLIQTNTTTDTSGVPYLMDIPWLGKLFRVDSDSDRRTETMMLIVPYVIDDNEDAKAVTQAMHDLMSMQ